MKKIAFFTLYVLFSTITNAQVTINPPVKEKTTTYVISKITLYPDATIVHIDIPKGEWRLGSYWWANISADTYLEFSPSGDFFANKRLRIQEIVGYFVNESEPEKLNFGKSYSEIEAVDLIFPAIPKGISTIHIIEEKRLGGIKFYGIQIIARNDAEIEQFVTCEDDLKTLIDSSNISIAGIYEILSSSSDNNYRLALIKKNNQIYLIYLGRTDGGYAKSWVYGEVKAVLRQTAIDNYYKAEWYTLNKQPVPVNITFGETGMTVNTMAGSDLYIRMGSISNTTKVSEKWSGSGWALSYGYLVTNHHVIDGANAISIKGVGGDMNTGYSAEVVAMDKTNDIAILKINDSRFKGFGTIPYAVSSRIADKGEGIFVLGYPMTQVLGNEVKYTAGEINSRTGFQGDVATYQISAPVTHGNSGGPLFDSKGNVIGIVNSGITDKEIAENVGYAIKIPYLRILIESTGLNIKLPNNNIISTLSKQEKIKKVERFVYYIECSK